MKQFKINYDAPFRKSKNSNSKYSKISNEASIFKSHECQRIKLAIKFHFILELGRLFLAYFINFCLHFAEVKASVTMVLIVDALDTALDGFFNVAKNALLRIRGQA